MTRIDGAASYLAVALGKHNPMSAELALALAASMTSGEWGRMDLVALAGDIASWIEREAGVAGRTDVEETEPIDWSAVYRAALAASPTLSFQGFRRLYLGQLANLLGASGPANRRSYRITSDKDLEELNQQAQAWYDPDELTEMDAIQAEGNSLNIDGGLPFE
jgi:hypothetical protein